MSRLRLWGSRPPRRHRDLRRGARVGFAARRPPGRPV